jgi:hypothetical protein
MKSGLYDAPDGLANNLHQFSTGGAKIGVLRACHTRKSA